MLRINCFLTPFAFHPNAVTYQVDREVGVATKLLLSSPFLVGSFVKVAFCSNFQFVQRLMTMILEIKNRV